MRFILIFFITDLMLHYIYIPLMETHDPFPIYLDECKTDLDYAFKIFKLSAWCYLCVFFLWAKFLLIWRYQRLIALCDAIVAPENMLRCVYHNILLLDFGNIGIVHSIYGIFDIFIFWWTKQKQKKKGL